MSFLVLLLAVWIEKFSALRHRIQRDGGWVRELHKLESSPRLINHPWWVLVILVLLPVALLGLLLVVLEPVAYGLLALPVHLLVVIYSLGRGDLQGGLGPFRDAWRREDLQAAAHVESNSVPNRRAACRYKLNRSRDSSCRNRLSGCSNTAMLLR